MRPLSSSSLVVAAALLLAAPVSPLHAQGSSAPPASQQAPAIDLPAPARTRADRNLISAQDIAAHPSATAYELVRSLHPQWLRGRGQTSLALSGGAVRVYQDGQPVGGAEALQRITAESVGEIRFVDSREAVLRWGAEHGGGAILVTTR